VAEQGLVGAGVELIAPLLPLTPESQTYLVRRFDSPYLALYTAPFGELPVFAAYFGPLGARFPWIFDVPPDGS